MARDFRQALDEGAMSRFQWVAVAICVMLNALDGFDVLVMAFTAASVSAEWRLSGAELGVLFSAGLLGMAAGSLLLAPMADRWGRQPVILLCLVLISVGMLLSALSGSHVELAAMRALTGLGIGGMLASVTVITAEYSSAKYRSTNIALQSAGYPLGATVGGVIAAWLLSHYGWRSVFVFGGVVTAVMIPVVLWRLPESVDFLVARRPRNALQRLNTQLLKMGQPALAELPVAATGAGAAASGKVSSLFKGELAGATAAIWAAFFLLMFSFYFALSWTPKLLVAAGLSAQQGITGGVLLNIGGMLGGSLLGVLAVRLRLVPLVAGSMLLAALSLAAFAAVTGHLNLAFAAAFAIGLFLFASMAGLYAIAPVVYGAAVRTTALGWAIAAGRVGAIVAPLTAGMLLDGGWTPAKLYYVFALPMVGAMVAVLALRRRTAMHPPPRVVGAH
ncbi:MFS transporter [Azohydromonas caseinilytica]|uniref:MFS transporter n=1 Tax=Azohydromonas caseinilytica TaxID=2728836 RepID=A0A848F9N3_9BURK|nr:MFS transporter [Azohydromonas caseinilytica]NML16042.1 MFS transporter [Azohydromonas caseinilytica]